MQTLKKLLPILLMLLVLIALVLYRGSGEAEALCATCTKISGL